MALLHPKIPNIVVNTGGNLPEAWDTIYQLQKKGLKILTISSFLQGYPTYYEYIKEDKVPFYKSCSHKAKQIHLNKLASIFRPITYNIGIVQGEKERVDEWGDPPSFIKYNFPMLTYTREQCEKVLRTHGVTANKSGCWFCGKQPKSSWEWLKETHPDKFEEARVKGWLPKSMIVGDKQ